MTTASSRKSHPPSSEEWNIVRPLITKLWYQDRRSLPFVIHRLQNDHGLTISTKSLKTKLQTWGLSKNLNVQDAESLLAAQARLESAGTNGILLLRGRVENIRRVRKYQRRRARTLFDPTSACKTKEISGYSNAFTLTLYPQLRLEPTLCLLGKFESVLRETQYLLQASNSASICIPGCTTVDWSTSSIEAENLERSLLYSSSEGARAFEDGNLPWACLCWKSALLALEDLLWEPDLNIWLTFIRCCIRLVRFGAREVAQHFLGRLRWLRDELPYSAPHRAFIFALSDTSIDDLVDGSIFLLEAVVRNLELLWPLNRECRTAYHVLLLEQRMYHGLDAIGTTSCSHIFELPNSQNLERDTFIQRSQISAYMLSLDYEKAEIIARNNISRFEEHMHHIEDRQGTLCTSLIEWYLTLGTIQYYQADNAQSQDSYIKSIQLHREADKARAAYLLQPPQLHRMLTLLTWVSSESSCDSVHMPFDPGAYKQEVETELRQYVQQREDAPFLRRSARRPRTTSPGNSKKTRNGNCDTQSLPQRSRIVQPPVVFRVDRNKRRNGGTTRSSTRRDSTVTWRRHEENVVRDSLMEDAARYGKKTGQTTSARVLLWD